MTDGGRSCGLLQPDEDPPADRLLLSSMGPPSRLLAVPPAGGNIEVLVPDLGVAPDGIGLAIDGSQKRARLGDLGGVVRMVGLDHPRTERVVFAGHGPLTGIAYLGARVRT